MITPRRTRLLRVPGLAAFRAVLLDAVRPLDAVAAADTFLLVPTRAAAEQLRRTLEDGLLMVGSAAALPQMGTRSDLYAAFAMRLAEVPALLTPFDREVLMAGVAREVEEGGIHPPFRLRPALVAEMLLLYDHIRRQSRTVQDFDRVLREALEPEVDTDRGAAQLLDQTRFLAAVYAGYEGRLAGTDLVDEHVLRAALALQPAVQPLTRVVVTVADRAGDPDGLWPVDFALLSTIAGLLQLDIVATERLLSAGWMERVNAALPGIEDIRSEALAPATGVTLVVPGDASASRVFSSRDREEELAQVARRLKAERRLGRTTPLDRTALVVKRPLPYLYLARAVFGNAGIPFETLDTLPLAAEAYAAALDLVLDFVTSDYSRASAVALLRSPHFSFVDGDAALSPASIGAFDRGLADARYLGELPRLTNLVERWRAIAVPASRDERRQHDALPAARATLQAATDLQPLAELRPVPAQIAGLLTFLHTRRNVADADDDERLRRVAGAVLSAIFALGEAYRLHDPAAQMSVVDLSFTIRRWLGAQTFASRTGSTGVQIVDAQAARFGEFDDVQLVGLVEGEWPERGRRSIFFPASLLAQLDPAPAETTDATRRERDQLRAARAAFADLMELAHTRVRVSTFALEADAVVEPSTFVDDLAAMALPTELEVPTHGVRVFMDEALAAAPHALVGLSAAAAEWALARTRDRGEASRFKGQAGPWLLPRVSISRVDRYLGCPFQFFASEVLKLEEQPEDEDVRPPLERGRFLHELFETFFRAWQTRGHGRIAAAQVPEARRLMIEICNRALADLPDTEAALERARLFGSAVRPGMVDRVLSMEAERQDEVRERLIEYPVEGAFVFETESGDTRTVKLSAKIDRVDLLADGTFRLIDYKSNKLPDIKRKVQLPVYTACVSQRLSQERGVEWRPKEALYLSFEGTTPMKALKATGQTIDDLVTTAGHRMLRVLDDIGSGRFQPDPNPRSLCNLCPYALVCRKEIVEAVDE